MSCLSPADSIYLSCLSPADSVYLSCLSPGDSIYLSCLSPAYSVYLSCLSPADSVLSYLSPADGVTSTCHLVPQGNITYSRQVLKRQDLPDWERRQDIFPKLRVDSGGTIEDDGEGRLQVGETCSLDLY